MSNITKRMTTAFLGAALATATTAEAAEKRYGAICYGRGASESIGGFDNKIYGFGIEFSANEKGNVTKFKVVEGTEPTPEFRVIDQMCKYLASDRPCIATFRNSTLTIQPPSIISGSFFASIANGNYSGRVSEVNKKTGKYETSLWGVAKCEVGTMKPGY